jgi:predicted phage terminase large subunit-like protein
LKTTEEQALEAFERIKLPSAVAQHLAMKVMGKPYKLFPWVAYVEREIVSMLSRPGREVLILSVPPQSGKTTYCGMWLPTWYLGMNPDDLVIFVAYSGDYAGTWGRRVRDIIDFYGRDLFDVGLNRSEQAINAWKTDRGFGGMLSAGIDGGITGNPGHFIIIDDVIKNMQEAGSPTTKRHHIEEWDGSISARFQENTKVLITATRWSEDDLSGEVYQRSIEEGYEGIPVRMIKIKAIAHPGDEVIGSMSDFEKEQWRDELGRKIGDHLRGQHSADFFRQKKASISRYVWNSLYQADPSAREGSMFPPDNWGWYDPDEPLDWTHKLRMWDVAATEGAGDWTVGSLAARLVDGRIAVLDVQRKQLSSSGVMDLVKKTASQDTSLVQIRMEQERAGAGKSTIGHYETEMVGYDFGGVKAEGEKISRFMPYSDLQQRGHVLLPRRKDGSSPAWVAPFVEEHRLQMPPVDGKARGPKNDDQIDTMAYVILELHGVQPVEIFDPGQLNQDGISQIVAMAEAAGYQLQPDVSALRVQLGQRSVSGLIEQPAPIDAG